MECLRPSHHLRRRDGVLAVADAGDAGVGEEVAHLVDSLVEDVVEGRAAGVVGRRHRVHDGVERPRHQEAVGAEALAQLRVAVCKKGGRGTILHREGRGSGRCAVNR